jgi:hypothetical protein
MMKRYLLFFGAIMLFSATLLTSCSSDNPTADLPPSIGFVTEAGYISSNATVLVSTPFKVKVSAQANATSGSKIESIRITRLINNQTVGDTTFSFNEAAVIFEVTFMSYSVVGVENIEFKATDKDGQSKTASLQITTEEPAGDPIDSWEMRILGSWNNLTVGSSFASINGNVYMLDQAFANQALIDFIYWWGASTSATIGAPNDANAAQVFNTGAYALSNWTTLNATQFKTTTLTSADFDAVTDAAPCISNATGADQTRIGTLAVDQVIAFISVGGKHGLIRVKAITDGSAGDITIDVKVQQ